MAVDKNINDSTLIKLVDADFANALNRMYASRVGGTEDGYLIITELITFIQSTREEIIHIPSTQPVISGGNLTLDMNNRRQAMFEGRLSTGTLTINSDFNFVISNDSNALLLSCVLSLTGTRIITFESDVLLSNASSIGTWASPALTLTAGTDDIIEFQLLRYSTNSNWLLKVAEVAI